MSRVGLKQPSEEKTFDIDLSNELKRSDEIATSILSIADDASVLTYTNSALIGAKLLRVTIGGGVDSTNYTVTIKVETNYSPIIEMEVFIAVAET